MPREAVNSRIEYDRFALCGRHGPRKDARASQAAREQNARTAFPFSDQQESLTVIEPEINFLISEIYEDLLPYLACDTIKPNSFFKYKPRGRDNTVEGHMFPTQISRAVRHLRPGEFFEIDRKFLWHVCQNKCNSWVEIAFTPSLYWGVRAPFGDWRAASGVYNSDAAEFTIEKLDRDLASLGFFRNSSRILTGIDAVPERRAASRSAEFIYSNPLKHVSIRVLADNGPTHLRTNEDATNEALFVVTRFSIIFTPEN